MADVTENLVEKAARLGRLMHVAELNDDDLARQAIKAEWVALSTIEGISQPVISRMHHAFWNQSYNDEEKARFKNERLESRTIRAIESRDKKQLQATKEVNQTLNLLLDVLEALNQNMNLLRQEIKDKGNA